MTTDEIIAYYVNLLIIQYQNLPNATGTIEALVTMPISDQVTLAVQNAFNLIGPDTAVGVQLDILGKYAGVTRSGFGAGDVEITLDDADFLTLIQIAVLKNNSGSSLSEIQNLLNTFFPGEIFVFDHQNMRMDYYINSSIGSFDLAQLVVSEGLLPQPMGVQVSATIYAPIINAFFGFRTYLAPGYNNSPLNSYTSYNMNWPFLSYADAIVI